MILRISSKKKVAKTVAEIWADDIMTAGSATVLGKYSPIVKFYWLYYQSTSDLATRPPPPNLYLKIRESLKQEFSKVRD
jgi:hypothetical protein